MDQVKVIETTNHQVLFQCHLDEVDNAYHYARTMEEMGIEVEIKVPSIAETLGSTLGVSEDELDEFKEEMEQEIASHLDEDSCCFKK